MWIGRGDCGSDVEGGGGIDGKERGGGCDCGLVVGDGGCCGSDREDGGCGGGGGVGNDDDDETNMRGATKVIRGTQHGQGGSGKTRHGVLSCQAECLAPGPPSISQQPPHKQPTGARSPWLSVRV